MENTKIGNFEVDVELMADGTFDVYLSHDGSSGEHYEHVSADRIGSLLADDIEAVAAENCGVASEELRHLIYNLYYVTLRQIMITDEQCRQMIIDHSLSTDTKESLGQQLYSQEIENQYYGKLPTFDDFIKGTYTVYPERVFGLCNENEELFSSYIKDVRKLQSEEGKAALDKVWIISDITWDTDKDQSDLPSKVVLFPNQYVDFYKDIIADEASNHITEALSDDYGCKPISFEVKELM